MNQKQTTPHGAGRGDTSIVLADAKESITPEHKTAIPGRPTSERLSRTLAALANGGELSNRQISKISGQLNGPDIIHRLRKLGWVIHCRLVTVVDRDGKRSHPGRWRLDQTHLSIAREMVSEHDGGDAA